MQGGQSQLKLCIGVLISPWSSKVEVKSWKVFQSDLLTTGGSSFSGSRCRSIDHLPNLESEVFIDLAQCQPHLIGSMVKWKTLQAGTRNNQNFGWALVKMNNLHILGSAHSQSSSRKLKCWRRSGPKVLEEEWAQGVGGGVGPRCWRRSGPKVLEEEWARGVGGRVGPRRWRRSGLEVLEEEWAQDVGGGVGPRCWRRSGPEVLEDEWAQGVGGGVGRRCWRRSGPKMLEEEWAGGVGGGVGPRCWRRSGLEVLEEEWA